MADSRQALKEPKRQRPAAPRAPRALVWGAALLASTVITCTPRIVAPQPKTEAELAEVFTCHLDQGACIPKHIVQDKEGLAKFLKTEKGVKKLDLSKVTLHSSKAALKRLEWVYKGTPVETGLKIAPLMVFELPNAVIEEAFPGANAGAGVHIHNTNIVLLNADDENINVPDGFIFVHEVAHYLAWLGGATSTRSMPVWMLEGLTNLTVCRSPGLACNSEFFGELPERDEPYAMATNMVVLMELSGDKAAYQRAFLYGDFEAIQRGFDAKMGEGMFAQFQGEKDIIAAVRLLMRKDKYFYAKFMGPEELKDELNAVAHKFFDGLWMIFPKP